MRLEVPILIAILIMIFVAANSISSYFPGLNNSVNQVLTGNPYSHSHGDKWTDVDRKDLDRKDLGGRSNKSNSETTTTTTTQTPVLVIHEGSGGSGTLLNIPNNNITTTGCTNHAQCSQACTNACPYGVYGCCSGCNIGQCDLSTGQCYCSSSAYYCGTNASIQVGQQCIYTTTTITTTPTPNAANNPLFTGTFLENSFSCNAVMGGNYCSFDYSNGLGNTPIITILFTNSDGDVVTNAVMYAQQGLGSNGALFYCNSHPAGTYYASWKVYGSSDNGFTNATAWSAASDRQQFIC